MKLRKKLTMTIIGLIVNWLTVWLANKNIQLTPEDQLHLIEGGMVMSAVIIGLFNYGQGLADKGKEAIKMLLVIYLAGTLMFLPALTWAQPSPDVAEAPLSIELEQCKGDYKACMKLLDECEGPECPPVAECPDCEEVCENKCGWVTLVKDKTFMTAVLGGVVFLVGGIAGIFLGPPN